MSSFEIWVLDPGRWKTDFGAVYVAGEPEPIRFKERMEAELIVEQNGKLHDMKLKQKEDGKERIKVQEVDQPPNYHAGAKLK